MRTAQQPPAPSRPREIRRRQQWLQRYRNNDWFDAASGGHGEDGPLVTALRDLAPISRRVLESCEDKGMPVIPDMFTTGEASRGCGHAVRSIYQGVRTTSCDYIGIEGDRVGIKIVTGKFVDKIVLEEQGGELVATEVTVRNAAGQIYRVAAR